jgi:hypothetical protein
MLDPYYEYRVNVGMKGLLLHISFLKKFRKKVSKEASVLLRIS